MHLATRTRPREHGRLMLSALGCVLILLLALGSANPEFHAWLHSAHAGHAATHGSCRDGDASKSTGDQLDSTHVCAVTLFAQGLLILAPASAAPAQSSALAAVLPLPPTSPQPPRPRHLHPPAHAPPAA